MLVIIGVIALLASVGFTVVAFSLFGLNDRQQALGLPEGSVRAIIALMLIIIFSIVTVHFFTEIGTDNAPQVDFAKQIITILGTLVTAIASFYFGSRAVEAVTGGLAASSKPVLNGIDPNHAPAGTAPSVTISGDNLLQVQKAKLVLGAKSITATNVLSNASRVTCTFTIDTTADKGKWDVIVETADGTSATLPAAFDVQ